MEPDLPGMVRIRFQDRRDNRGFAVYAYLILGDGECALVDSGFGGAHAFEELEAQVNAAGRSLDEIRTVVITHLHHDHVGQAGRLVERGAKVGFHPAEPTVARNPDRLAELGRFLHLHGTPADDLPDRPYEADLPLDLPIEDGDRVNLAGQEWIALRTPGHTGSHLCYFRPGGPLLSGDYLLADQPTYVGADPLYPGNILADFLASLDRIDALDATALAAAHGPIIADISSRTADMRVYYAERLDAVEALLGDRPTTAFAVARELREQRGRSWATLESFRRGLLVRHAVAMLDQLAATGRAERVEEAGVAYRRSG